MLVQNRDIIIVGLQAWDTAIGSNCKNIAQEFAKHNRVLYVNYPLDRITVAKEKHLPQNQKRLQMLRGDADNLVQVEENIWVFYPNCILESINWVVPTSLFRILNKMNNRRFAAEIKKAAGRLAFDDFILFNDSDMFRSFYLKELLQPALYVYYSRDNLMGVPYWYKHGHKLEPELFAKSDLVTANSTYLAAVARQHNRHSYYVGQGCETEDFHPGRVTGVPTDIASIRRPIIGYMGALFQLRLDLSLLEELALLRPDWSFVFIGPEDDAFRASPLHQQPNVHFLGLKQTKELPAYLAQFNVAINPQKVNEVTIGNYPRKIDEYLAMGKAVVATPTEAMKIFADHVRFATNADEYAEQIEHALAENPETVLQERMQFARTHTWENSVQEIYKAMYLVKPELFEPVKAIAG